MGVCARYLFVLTASAFPVQAEFHDIAGDTVPVPDRVHVDPSEVGYAPQQFLYLGHRTVVRGRHRLDLSSIPHGKCRTAHANRSSLFSGCGRRYTHLINPTLCSPRWTKSAISAQDCPR
jgi:hypothetical protein